MNLAKYDTVILDCDGVVFDTNILKVEAFSKTFEELGFDKVYIDKFVAYMKNNFGVSRYKFAEYFIKNILKRELDTRLYENIIDIYSKKSYELYFEAEFTENLLEFLEFYKGKRVFIASGSKEDELKEVFKHRKIDRYFQAIYGSPKKKDEIVGAIARECNNCIMIGDSRSDMIAAKNAKIDFIFMYDYSISSEMINNKNLISIKNLGVLVEK